MQPTLDESAKLVGRVWRADVGGPCVVAVRNGELIDITARWPTVSDLVEANASGELASGEWDRLDGEPIGPVGNFIHPPDRMVPGDGASCLLAPCDLQALKACGVTFAQSMIERVIDERTSGDPEMAETIRRRIGDLIGDSLTDIVAGSDQAQEVKKVLIAEGIWSQYLEVGIGRDAEVFTKSQPMAAVGHGALVGVHPDSRWSNPEPEIVLAISPSGAIRGATLGNDVNLRDIEGRSALLLGKAKDNNASCAIGPFIRLFDDAFTLAAIEATALTMTVTGVDGFEMSAQSHMNRISRRPADLVAQTIGRHHQYPDGLMLFLGTMFAPTQDRGETGSGFTHKEGDVVRIECPLLGTLENTVTTTDRAPGWTFGSRALMRNLAARGLA